MAELSEEPSNMELLERIERIEAENATLKARVDDLSKGMTVMSRGLADEIIHMGDFLWPVVHKVFPKFSNAKSQFDQIVPPTFADPRADRRRSDKAE